MINKQLTFLIVDDIVSMRNAINSLVRSMGYTNILTAKDGAEALRILKSQPVNIVVSDWEMPVMDGLALLNAVRAEPLLQQLPFLMISDGTNRHQIKEVISNGASDFLIRPYTGRDLASRIEKIVTCKPVEILAPPDPPIKKKAKRTTILIVDDGPDNQLILSSLFKDEYRVRVADNGKKALAICKSDDPPDLVLLDIMMPSMNGFEVAKRMRDDPVSEQIPIIFVTAINNDDVRLKGLELGAIDFVAKPINPDVLKPRVRNFLRYVELHKLVQKDYDLTQEVAQLKDDVKNIIRYDMKEPLAEVIGLIQVLSDDVSMDATQFEKLQAVEKMSLQMLDMINLSSELYKIESGIFQLNAQPIDIGSILRRITEVLRNSYAKKQLTITISYDKAAAKGVAKTQGDAMLSYSLFNNLIKNACEMAPGGSTVAIGIANEDPVLITIQNKGTVPEDLRENFFDKFIPQEKPTGTRMGFYSAKLFTEAQNGKINLEVLEKSNLTMVSVCLPQYEEASI